MGLPKFLQPYLASYDLSQLDVEQDKELIITEVLNKGNYMALEWLGKNYSGKEIKRVVAVPTRGMWFRSVLGYWQKIFDIKLPKQVFDRAVINLRPR